MSFQQGLSGLNAASKQLEVVGNNIANANTVGFKQARAEFADVYANSLSGGGGTSIGIGTKLATVAQQFTQGNITSTSNTLDLAVNGGGFFRMSSNGVITYSRNGQFQLDRLGNVVDAEGKILTGYAADVQGNLQTGSPVPINIDTADIQPLATTAITGTVNFDSRKTPPTTAPFDPTDPDTYNDSTALTVYDSLGNAHTVQSYYVKTAANTWDTYTTADGLQLNGIPSLLSPTGAGNPTGTLVFLNTGLIDTTNTIPAPPTLPSVTFSPLTPPPTSIATGGAPVTLTLDFNSSTQFGSTFSINALEQDGYTAGRLAGFNTGADGKITGRYSNGQSKVLGQVVLANFVNPNGLQSLGGNAWAESSTSGVPLVGAPSTGSLGVLQSSAVEDSNTDLTQELVNLITAQRYYQANAQTIKTQDQVLQTLVNLR